jgi:hypothetical protein
MLSWWRQRKERQQQVIRDADNLMALFGGSRPPLIWGILRLGRNVRREPA